MTNCRDKEDEQVRKEMDDFASEVNHFIGVYADLSSGLRLFNEKAGRAYSEVISMLKSNDESSDYESLPVIFGRGQPNAEPPDILHHTTQKELLTRSSEDGDDRRLLGNMIIVMIYQIWEDHYRPRIANILGKEKNDVDFKLMGELRHYRRSILHNNGISLPQIPKCEMLPWFEQGERIFLDMDKIHQLARFFQSFRITVK